MITINTDEEGRTSESKSNEDKEKEEKQQQQVSIKYEDLTQQEKDKLFKAIVKQKDFNNGNIKKS